MTSLIRQLRQWQFLEWAYAATHALAMLLAAVALGLAAACLTDWIFDRYRDTPLWLRAGMTGSQIVVFFLLGGWLFWRVRKPSLDFLAGQAETAIPQLDHRLVTALQLNRDEARTQGMSRELIDVVTKEAESITSQHRLTKLASPRPLFRAVAILLPVVLLVGTAAATNPQLTWVLLQRQALQNVEIPRSNQVLNATKSLFPSGDAVELEFRVTGPIDPSRTGVVKVTPEPNENQSRPPTESYEARHVGQYEDGSARYIAKLPPASEPFRFTARIGDGRMRQPARVQFEPRPIVSSVVAWVLLPTYVDPANTKRYERLQQQGEVLAPADSAVRVQIETSKPVTKAQLSVLGRDGTGAEIVLLTRDMELSGDRRSAGVVFDLPLKPTGYRIDLLDDYGFANLNPPRRGITIAADEPPIVDLLDEVLKDPQEPGPIDDFEVKGMPLTLNGQVQIGYRARSVLGLSKAYIIYRVNDGNWMPLPLSRVEADLAKVGKFVPDLGVFENSGLDGQVEFYPLPSPDPESEPAGLAAGGRYNFKTAAIMKTGPDGKAAKLEIGDRVEFYVAVYDRKPALLQDPTDRGGAGRPPGISEARIKAVVTASQLEEWNRQRDQSRDRLRRIQESQRGVFGQKTMP